jgi:flagellar biosynthesis protein FlhG
MRPLEEQSLYDTLEVTKDASPEDVERAYQLARSLWEEGSLAGYGVTEPGDVELIRERVELAYRTLRDPEERQLYDAQLEQASDAAAEPAAARTLDPLDAMADLDEAAGEFDGERLRRVRLQRGLELEEIAKVTKVNPTYLRFIEEERFDELPAAVYVRGFVVGYASCVGLEGKRVAKSYMTRFEESRDNPKRRLFSRR